MTNLNQEDIQELQKQLMKGSIQRAYKALLSYMMSLRARFASRYVESDVSGLYQGYLDMTYFAVSPPMLKGHDLKVAIVFNYDAFKFEAWLSARNRKVQRQYWDLFKDMPWSGYRVIQPASGIDSILECDLATEVDFNNMDALTTRIETTAARFISDIEKFFTEQQS